MLIHTIFLRGNLLYYWQSGINMNITLLPAVAETPPLVCVVTRTDNSRRVENRSLAARLIEYVVYSWQHS